MKRKHLICTAFIMICLVSCTKNQEAEVFELLSCEDQSGKFIQVDTKPVFINEERFKENATTYPEMANRAGIEGTVWVSFKINEVGATQSARIERGIGAGADEQSLKGVNESEFIAAKLKGVTLCSKIFGRFIYDLDQVDNTVFYLEDEMISD